MEDWIYNSKTENNYHIDVISVDKLHSEFQKENIVEPTTMGLDKFKFLDVLFNYIKSINNYH